MPDALARDPFPTEIALGDAEATDRLARALAPHLGAGDVLALSGGLGAGKSSLARALIAARLAAVGRVEEIPSPSYTLVQTYDLGGVELWHADLYRLGAAEETAELGLDEAFETAICLVEWPDRLGEALPARRLDLALAFAAEADARRARLVARGAGWEWLAGALAALSPGEPAADRAEGAADAGGGAGLGSGVGSGAAFETDAGMGAVAGAGAGSRAASAADAGVGAGMDSAAALGMVSGTVSRPASGTASAAAAGADADVAPGAEADADAGAQSGARSGAASDARAGAASGAGSGAASGGCSRAGGA